MCGILGIISPDKRTDLSEVNTRALKNRGPDGSGEYVDTNVGFYHTRLAVVDKKVTSAQPIVSEDKNLILICNGEIYNYQDLKKQKNYNYKTTSDCEAILGCYSEDGVEGFRRLKGTFSFGLYDKIKKKVFIYRDAVGKKPLFYCQSKGGFFFSSSIDTIRDNISEILEINEEALSYYLKEGYIRPDITFYNGIKPVMPGTLVEIDITTGKRLSRHIIPESAPYDDFRYDYREIMQETERLLTRSIEARIDNIREPVLLFSGGVDSTILAKLISLKRASELRCISLRPLVPLTYDEPYSRYAAWRLRLNNIFVSLVRKKIMESIEMAILLLDQPLSSYSYYLLTYLTRKAREFGNVLFIGEGADEVFYGYKYAYSWFAEDELLSDSYEVGPRPIPALSAWGKKQITANLLGHTFVKIDKATQEQQMEARCPYLDWDLMNFVRRIPGEYFIKTKMIKAIPKYLLAGFPPWFVNRRKVGFGFNFRYLLAPFYKFIYDRIDFGKLAPLGVTISHEKFSSGKMFRFFDHYWKLYVLSKFIEGKG